MKRPRRPRSVGPAPLLAAALAAIPLSAHPATAAPRTPVPTTCAPAPGDAPVTLASVSDTFDVALADGRILRLAGLDPPGAATPALAAEARRALLAWAAAGPLTLQGLAATPDRWNRVPVLLFHAGVEPASAAEALLGAGLARVAPEQAVAACLPGFLAAEEEARAARRGLWAEARYAVLTPADVAGFAAQAGGLALVQGVLHLHESRGALYLALGRDRWGFTAMVSRRDAGRFLKAGLDLHDYEGTPVRLRGDLDARFGPRLRLTEPGAVESLEPGSVSEEPEPAKHWTVGAAHR